MPTIPFSIRLTELERNWYQVRVPGASAQTPLGELQAEYWRQILGKNKSVVTSKKDLQIEWMKKMINNNGGSGSANADVKQLWKEVVASFGYPVAINVHENMRTFYQKTTTNP